MIRATITMLQLGKEAPPFPFLISRVNFFRWTGLIATIIYSRFSLQGGLERFSPEKQCQITSSNEKKHQCLKNPG